MLIPKIIHQVWLGGPMSKRDIEWAKLWKVHQPDWQLWLWTDHPLSSATPHDCHIPVYERSWVNMDCIGTLREVLLRSNVPAGLSDLLRLEILARHGGIYVDTDYIPLQPLEPLLEGVKCFIAEEQGLDSDKKSRVIGNFIMGATPGHPAIWAMVRQARHNIDMKLREAKQITPVSDTGPHMVRDVGTKYAECVVFPWPVFSPFNGAFAAPDDLHKYTFPPSAYGCHVFSTRWTDRKMRPLTPDSKPTIPTWSNGHTYGDLSAWEFKKCSSQLDFAE